MRNFTFKKILPLMLIFSILCQNSLALTSKDMLGMHSMFDGKSAQSLKDILNVYFKYTLNELISINKDLSKLTIDDINAIKLAGTNIRINILSIENIKKNKYSITCDINGKKIDCLLSILHNDFSIQVLPAKTNVLPRFLPTMARASVNGDNNEINQILSVLNVETENILHPDYNNTKQNRQTIFFITKNLIRLISLYSKNSGKIKNISTIQNFIKYISDPNNVFEITDPTNKVLIFSIFDAIPKDDHYFLNNIAKTYAALGKLYYEHKNYTSYKTSTFCFEISHALFPEDLYYRNSWIWSLYKSGHEYRPKAKKELEKLIAEYPNENKLLLELANIQMEEVNTATKKREKNNQFSLSLLMTQDIPLLVSLEDVLKIINNKAFYSYPRAVSCIGKTYAVIARLQTIILKTYKQEGTFPPEGLCLEGINNISKSFKFLKKATDLKNTIGQQKHADKMWQSVQKNNIHLLEKFLEAFLSNPHALLNNNFELALNKLDSIKQSCHPEIADRFKNIFSKFEKNYKITQQINKVIRTELTEGAQEGVLEENLDEFWINLETTTLYKLDSLKTNIHKTITLEYYVKNIINYLKNSLEIDQLSLAIIYLRMDENSKIDITEEYLFQEVSNLGLEMPSEKDFITKLRISLSLINHPLKIRESSESKKKNTLSNKSKGAEKNEPLLKPDSLSQNCNISLNHSLIFKISKLNKEASAFTDWENYNGKTPICFKAGYFSLVSQDTFTLLERMKKLASEIKEYIPKTKSKDKNEKQQARSDGEIITKKYYNIKEKYTILQEQVPKRKKSIQDIIDFNIDAIELEVRKLTKDLNSLESDWLKDNLSQIHLILTSLKEEKNNGLSFSKVSYLLQTIHLSLTPLSEFSESFSLFSSYFDTLNKSKSRLNSAAKFFGDNSIFEELSAAIEKAEKNLLNLVIDNKTPKNIPKELSNLVQRIEQKTLLSKDFINHITKSSSKIIEEYSPKNFTILFDLFLTLQKSWFTNQKLPLC